MEHIIKHLVTTAEVLDSVTSSKKEILEHFAFALAELSVGMNSGDLLSWSDISRLADELAELAMEVR